MPGGSDRRDAAVDVVVVGGGIAGLVTATRLLDAGVGCRVLERDDRIGGRLLTHTSDAGRFDLGATWFWPGERRVAALVGQLGVATHPQHVAGDAMYHVPGGAQRIDGNPIDVTASRFSHGAASLAEHLGDRLGDVVSLRTPVHAIERAAQGLRVTHAHGSIRSQHVVLAVPPPVAVRSIELRPPLPEDLHRLATATPVWMATTAKAVVVYAEPFWRRRGLAGAAISHVGPLRELHDMSGPNGDPAALFGFAPLGPADPAPTEGEVVDQLVDIFGAGAATPLEVVIRDWRHDPGAKPPVQAPLTATQTYGHPRFQAPAGDGRIHWASTETAPEAPGHIEGAIAAAERTVAAITNHLAPVEQPPPGPHKEIETRHADPDPLRPPR